ncbi:signal peptidase II [Candidatus Woesearchaeota archaeon]|nr:signal peptidase II [Candidatus Woesearchaeota archaeon]
MVKSIPWLFYVTGLVVFLLDHFSKSFVVNNGFRYTTNTGAAFGILQGQTWLLIFIAVVVIAVLVYYSHEYQLALGFLLGGTLGNLLDRVFYGYVIDFIHVPFWPSFNLADSFNVIGVGLLLLDAFARKK